MRAFCSKEAIIQNLKDAGCDEAIIPSFMDDLNDGRQLHGTQLLKKHRCNLLDDLHRDQKRIDCLDYLIFMLQKQE